MTKVLLLNNQGGTYGLPLSDEAIEMIWTMFGIRVSKLETHIDCIFNRDSPVLLAIVDKLGARAFDHTIIETKWRIVEVPDDMHWWIAFRDNGDEILYDTRYSIEPCFED